MPAPNMSRRAFATAAAASAVTVIAGCSSSPRKSSSGSSKTPDKVTFVTGYGTVPREEYIQIGIAKGYFKDANIEVEVQAGQPSDANLKTMTAGKTQFAMIDYVSAIRGASTYLDGGKPNYRIICAVQQRTLLSLLTLDSTGITRPADLEGKTLGSAANAAGQTLFPTYAKLAGFDGSKCKYVNATSDQLPALLAAGQIQALNGYSLDVPTVTAAAKGHKAIALPYADYIQDLYGSTLICTNSLVKSNPDLVKRFGQALMKGTQYAVAHPDEAAQIIQKALPTTNVAAATESYKLMQPYVGSGALDSTRVMRGISLLETAGLAKSGLQPEDILAVDLMPKAA